MDVLDEVPVFEPGEALKQRQDRLFAMRPHAKLDTDPAELPPPLEPQPLTDATALAGFYASAEQVDRVRTRPVRGAQKEKKKKAVKRSVKLSSKFLSAAAPDAFLGRHVPIIGNQTKGSVMHLLSRNQSYPTFSRMAGIQPFRDAIALFVNVGGTDYKNMFSEEGDRVSWFASAKQHEGTPVIQRVLRTCPSWETHSQCDVDNIFLFCRVVGQPYVYCGRLQYEFHDPDVRPMPFRWKLLDHKQVIAEKAYQELLAYALASDTTGDSSDSSSGSSSSDDESSDEYSGSSSSSE
jgi:hypothetical protein